MICLKTKSICNIFFFFFFQAEDGIRDYKVTGVQTCALPILRGYDPRFDYEALLYDLSGRRFNRADPGRSLMLAKPSLEVAHGGGRRFAKDSDYYKTIYA